ncbi:MAG: vitamin K-dependent gamma-carboxylase-related protein [Labilithrix sp.]|nr:vitamin K-dependent gamma-carboxylase-related protein [Labilithrix sp.]
MTRRSLTAALRAPTDTAALVVFRVVLGALVTVSAVRFLAYGWVDDLFVKPTFFLKYWGFSWVGVLPAPWMHVVFAALAVLGVCFASGLFYRVVAPLLFALFTYVQLVDVTNWLNHYYLVSLLLLLAAFMPLGRAGSLDALRRPETRLDAFPAWCTYLLRFQVGVVYLNAGLAKLSGDWLLHAQPLNIWLSARTGMPVVGAFFDERWVAYAFSWGGFLFDTTIAFFLAWRRTRVPAYVVVVGFHAMVGLLFPIGMFPFIMIAAALVFFSPSWPRRLAWGRLRDLPAPHAVPGARPHRAWAVLAVAYCVLQALVPLRAHLYGGNVLWHEQGMRLAWRVMVREKNGSITYLVSSKKAGRTWYVEPRRYLTDRQARELQSQPDLVLQLAHHVARDFQARGHDDVEVRVDTLVSLNGRPAAPMIDKTVDLARVHDGLGRAAWILPAPEGPPIHLRPAWNSHRLAAR